MIIKTIKKEKFNLHLLKTNKFKTTIVNTIFWEKIQKDEITIRNMLIDNLLFSSKNYPTLKDIAIKKEDLYGSSLTGYTYRKGSYIISQIIMPLIGDKYSEDNLLEKALNFYFDVLNNPNVVNNSFNKKVFDISAQSLKTNIKRINENPQNFSLTKYRELLGNEIYSYTVDGSLEDLEKITPQNLYNYYNKFTRSNNVDIFIAGDFSIEKVTNQIEKLYKYQTKNKSQENIYLSYNKEFSENKIPSKYNQSRVLMGGSISKLTDYEKKYTALLFNIIFGNSPNSKLFLNVREKHSYAYSISSSFSKIDGTFIINAGISKVNYEDTKKQVLKELEDMKQGKFTQRDINDAKQVILGVLNEIEDYQSSIINYYFNTLYFNDEEKDKQKINIKSITKEDIVKLANKIDIDTILLIEEENNETNTNK